MMKQVDMNGLWSGTYFYHTQKEGTPFTVWVDDQAGQLSGNIIEPNTFIENGPEELNAMLKGVRDGQIVDFVKVYNFSSGAHQSPIHYEGAANTPFTEVHGIWHFNRPDLMPGKFILSRVSKSLEKTVTRSKLNTVANDISDI